jgi:hypothetical protein
MADKKILSVLEALYRATEKGKVAWEIAASDNVFRAQIDDGGVRIECRASAPNAKYVVEGNPPAFSVWIVNAQNRVVEAFAFEPNEPGHGLLEKLFPLARKTAMNGDQVLDKMLAALEAKR